MRNRGLVPVIRVALLVAVLLVGTTALAGPLGYYNWSASTTGYVGEFTNSSSGGGVKANTSGTSSIGVYGYATGSTAQGTRGYNNTSGYGVYGRSVSGTGVYGENNSATSGYGGFFTGFNGLKGYTTAANGYAGWFNATGNSGFGVRAQSSASTGYGVYGTGGYMGVYGEGAYRGGYFVGTGTSAEGVRGYTASSGGDGVNAYATGSSGFGVHATSTGSWGDAVVGTASGTSAYGGSFSSDKSVGLYADGGSGQWDLWAPNSANIAGVIFPPKGGLALLARNDGADPLEPGDLVVFRGYDPAALGQGVVEAAGAGSAAGVVVGVVQGAYVLDQTASAPEVPAAQPETSPALQPDAGLVPPAPLPEGEAPQAPAVSSAGSVTAASAPPPQTPNRALTHPAAGRFVDGKVEAGQYMVVTFQGIVQVAVRAAQPIRAGDWIVVALDGTVSGAAVRATTQLLERGYTIVGRALEALDSGRGLIYVQVNLR